MDIREKIKKLLALATSPNENEARAALLKARALMAQHKLTEADFDKEQKLVHIVCNEVKWTTDSGEVWISKLCNLIAEKHCSAAAWRTLPKSRTHTLVLTGMGDDAKVCEEVIKYTVGFVRNAIKIAQRKSRRDEQVVAKSYADGFILGMEMAYDMQETEHPEWGLVVVKPDEVKKYEEGLGSKNVRTKKVEFDPLAYMRGQREGMEFGQRKAIETH